MVDNLVVLHQHEECEGIIIEGRTGTFYTTQTGGVCCNHPKAEGRWIPAEIPAKVQRLACCRSFFEGDANDRFDLDIINRAFEDAGIPFVAIHGEEAWLHGLYDGEAAIATWNNCD